ncbi:uncharacterized protein YrrD [Desulfitispora alkaliphila]|uniref:PRC-barrel domain-containing protein n=1 Tax=Desulfitispora alkaliphila TaxID=622674 RepID=UPI003D2423DC
MQYESKHFLGLPVVSLDLGQQLGVVKSLIIDPETVSLMGLVISNKGWLSENRFLPFSKVKSVGRHAVTTESSKSLEKIVQSSDHRQLEGVQVLSCQGNFLGTVEEFTIDAETGEIVTLELSGKLINSLLKGKASLPRTALQTMGKDVIVAVAGAEEKLTDRESAIQETVKSVREKTSKVLDSTVENSKKFTQGWRAPWKNNKVDLKSEKRMEDLKEKTENPLEENKEEKRDS